MSRLCYLDHVSYDGGHDTALSDITLEIHASSKIGVVGAIADSRQTTLLGLVAGTLAPTSGRIVRHDRLTIVACGRAPDLPAGATVAAILQHATVPAEHQQAGAVPAAAEALGCPQPETAAHNLDDGQRHRLGLTIAVCADADLLILQDPTRHLDIQAAEWLGEQLRNRRGAVLVSSHDRYLLDEVADTILEVDRSQLVVHHGNYLDYLSSRRPRPGIETYARQQTERRHDEELAWAAASPARRH